MSSFVGVGDGVDGWRRAGEGEKERYPRRGVDTLKGCMLLTVSPAAVSLRDALCGAGR